MQTPGGSSRPTRRCGRPKRFDDSDSDEPTSRSVSRKPAVTKRKGAQDYDNETPAKRQRILTSKVLSFKSSFQPSSRDDINWVSARKQKPTPKSVSDKWKQKHASSAKSTAYKGAGSADDEDEEGEDDDEEEEDENHLVRDGSDARGNQDEDEEEEEEEDEEKAEINADEELESMLSEYRQMFGKAVVDMSKGNAISNGSLESDTKDSKKSASTNESCQNCNAQKEEMEHLEEMIKLKDCEMQQILQTINSARSGGQKLSTSLSENIEKRMSYHKLYLETEKKMRNTVSGMNKWEALYNAEVKKSKDLELRCEALELKLKMEIKKQPVKTPGFVEVPAAKMKEFIEIKNFHYKNCNKMHDKLELLTKENATVVQTLQRSEQEFKNKFLRMKKHYHMLLEYYIQKDARLSKRKDFLDKKMAVYKDVGSRHQILRDAAKYLNENQLTFLSGQLSTEKNLTGKGNCVPPKYRELLLSIFQRSTIAYKVLKSFGFNFPPLLSMQQLAQSEAIRPNESAYTMLNARSRPVPAHQRTLRALCSDEEDEEIADLLDAATVQHDQSIVTDEEAEDGVDGDYGDVQPEDIIEEEEEEGGADYLSDDDPTFPSKLKEVQEAQQQQVAAVEQDEQEGGAPQEEEEQPGAPEEVQQADVTQQEAGGDELQQEYRTDIQEQLDNQLSSHLTAEPQFETMETGVMSDRSLAEQVDVMEEVVRQVTDVEQLESIDPIQSDDQIQEQIEISDTTSTQEDSTAPPAATIISTATLAVPAVGANDIVVSESGEENVGQNVEVTVPDVGVASAVEAPLSGEVEASLSGEVEASLSGEVEASLSGEVEAPLSGGVEASLSGEVEAPISGEVEAPISDEVEASLSGEVVAENVVEVTAETQVAERGADMPIL